MFGGDLGDLGDLGELGDLGDLGELGDIFFMYFYRFCPRWGWQIIGFLIKTYDLPTPYLPTPSRSFLYFLYT